jgi:N-dimethylarginine dimethylaminohydrolase
VVYRRLLPVTLFELLAARGIKLIDIPEEEYPSQGCNVLALAPREVLMLAGNPATRCRLEQAGCRVQEYRGDEISLKGSGGPTCLTRPLLRSW